MKSLRNLIQCLKGVTLVESMITVVVFSSIVGAIFLTLNVGSNMWEVGKNKIEIQNNLRIAMDRLRADLLKVSSSAILDVPADGNWYSTISFHPPNSVGNDGIIDWSEDTIEYLISAGKLVRQVESGGIVTETRPIAPNISLFQVRRNSATPYLIEISLTFSKLAGQRTLTTAKSMSIQLRN